MKRKHLFILTGIFFSVVLLMTILNFVTKKPNTEKNGFNRMAFKTPVTKLNEIHFDQRITDIAGITEKNIYITPNDPSKIIITDRNLKSEKQIDLNIHSSDQLKSNFKIIVHPPDLYILAANVPAIIHYNLDTKKEITYKINRAYSRCILVTPSMAIIRGFDSSFQDENLRKANLLTGTYTNEKNITEKTEGGGFSTDGMLNYDTLTNKVIYTHFYSNKILYLDTNLNLLYKGKAVDTFSAYQAKARGIKSVKGTAFGFAAPPKLLSLYSYTDKGKLFIYSKVKADNETSEAYQNNTIIDIYDINTGKYSGSLYIPVEQAGKRMYKFKVANDLLIALYDKSVVTYHININALL